MSTNPNITTTVNAPYFPNEVMAPIVGHLQDKKIDYFDQVAMKDLQNMRRVSRSMSAIATPLLFENMIFDLKFYRPEDMNRFAEFVRYCPALARHVHRLKICFPPVITDLMTDNPTKTHALLFGIRDGSEFEMDHLTKIRDALVLPVRNWKKNERSEKKKIKKRTSEIFKVYKSLPNLRYLENGVSTYYEEELASREMKLLEDDGITVKQHFDVGFELNEDLVYSSNYPPQCFSDHLASVRGAKILFCNAIQTITSLKIRSMPFYSKLGVVMVSQNLRCLNLEILRLSRRGTEIDDQERTLKDSDLPMTAVWRRYLYRLRQLETLRLGFLYGGRRDTEYLDNFYAIYHLDELLIDPDNMDDCCLLPKLKRLELFDSTVRLANLLRVIANHRETLKALTLTRITFELEESLRYWCEIARMCKEAAPGLTYLRLVKLVTGPPKRYVHDPEGSLFHGPNADSDLKPTPEGWRSGLEDAMTYEWQKGTANGTDREFIGIKCPWTGDEDEEAPSDSAANLIVGRDRFWSNHPDIVR